MASLMFRFGVCLVLWACNERNPLYCEGHPDDTVNCPPPDGSDRCTEDDQCPGQVCNTATGACVECTPDNAQACTGDTPVCGDDNACRGCAAHTECDSRACLPDGSCAAEADVAYVSDIGSGTACSQLAPCGTVAAGLSTNRAILKLAGTIDEAVTINSGRQVTFVAEPGAKLTRTGGNGAILTVADDNTSVTVVGLSISDAPNSPSGIGLVIPAASGAPRITLVRATVNNNPGGGIAVSGGSLAVAQSTVSGNQGGGISVTGVGATFDITNTFIIFNGQAMGAGATQTGGASLLPNTAVSRFEHNTVAFNENDGSIFRAGVTCAGALVSAAGNLVYGNREGTMTNDNTQRGGSCQFGNTLASGLVSGDLGFVSPLVAPFDFHLSTASPPSVVDAGGNCSGVDFDDESRPNGGACDLGADELYP